MSDIIDTIDRLHAKATPGPWKAIDRFGILGADCSKVRDWEIPNADLIVALVNNWPAISARLREAERKAKAFDVIEQAWLENRFDITIGGRRDDEFIDIDASGYNLLTAIEAALAAKETKQ